MRIRFMGCMEHTPWQPAYVDVKDMAELEKLKVVTNGIAPLEQLSRWEHNNMLTGIMLNFCFERDCPVCGNDPASPAELTATVEPMVNYPSHFEIWFRANGKLVGRGLITFNDRATADRYLKEMLNVPQASET